ncbi:MAG: ABC transporter permease [Chitinispirillales bacterium]|jgi:ABC-2 type transport system permease protein|nr:ABC transporter permease [Chitinispirillales bacterium]
MRVIYALWIRNLKIFVRNKPALVLNLVFPFFFIYVFGEIFRNDAIENHITYMLAGIIIATVFDISLRVSTTTIDDITSGFMKEVLVSPISRLAIAAGQFVSSATVATMQGLIIFVVGFFIGLRVTSPLTVIYVIFAMIFVGLVFAGFGLLIATKTKNIQTFQAVSIAVTMPMTFLSGAYIPLSLLNDVLTGIAYFNPMTYAVAFFRTIALEKTNLSLVEMVNEGLAFEIGRFTIAPMASMLILLVFGTVFLALSTITFVRVDFSRLNRNKSDSIEFE